MSLEKKHLQITQKGMEKYTGPLSVYEFVDGVSVDPIPLHDRDRIAATIPCVEIAENGREVIAGVSQRLVDEAKSRAPVHQKLTRQSVEDKVSEETAQAEKDLGAVKTIYTEDELDEIISDGGIAALREVASIWGVKNRSIPTLRQMVLDAQEEYVGKEGSRLEKHKAAMEDAVRKAEENNVETTPEPTPAPEADDDGDLDIDEDIFAAAASGDMAAAVNAEDEDPGDLDIDEDPFAKPALTEQGVILKEGEVD